MKWYCLNTRPQQEQRAIENLRNQRIESLLPLTRQRRVTDYTDRVLTLPLFPRYVFARFDLDRNYRSVSSTRGVKSIVTIGELPATVPDEVIDELMARMDSDGFTQTDDGLIVSGIALRSGDKVIGTELAGAWYGCEGIFQSCEKGRVRVLMEMLSRQYPIELPAGAIALAL